MYSIQYTLTRGNVCVWRFQAVRDCQWAPKKDQSANQLQRYRTFKSVAERVHSTDNDTYTRNSPV